jgi:cytochrome c-type biogenesis protein CcmF
VLALAVYATVAGALAGLRRDRRLARSAANAVLVAFVATAAAALLLLVALVRHDFSIGVVYAHTNRSLPTPYLLTALWASQPGSLLLWLLVLSGASSLVMLQNRHRNRELMPWVTAILGGIMTFFAGMAALVSSPTPSAPSARMGWAWIPRCRTPTWWPTRRRSTWGTSPSRCRSRLPWRR